MQQLVNKARQSVLKNRQLILDAHAYIWANPETGYREWKTARYLETAFENLGYELTRAGNVPGFYTDIDTGRPGPKVLIMGEMDSLICIDHPQADPQTHAVHACGHSAQSAALLGIAAALKEPGMLDGLSGSIRLMAVPAEELIEIGYREQLRRDGVIKYMGGKVEFMYRGYMDGCDMAILFHTSAKPDGDFAFTSSRGSNGCVTKEMVFEGRASHAGGSPHLGINALYAANLAINAVNALRETFRDNDHIRVHPIITKGGDAVNAIPAQVRVESYVRGASMPAIISANERVNRAMAGAALAMGANVLLTDRPGYHPLVNDPAMREIAETAMCALAGREHVEITENWGTGCTDMGDISAVMPTVQPYACGAVGLGHGNNYYVQDLDKACIGSAQAQVLMALMLLSDGAEKARSVIARKNTAFESMADYFAAMDAVELDLRAVTYGESSAQVSWKK